MTTASHDTLVIRLAQILVKLNQGEKLDPAALADEFCVNLRTIQRDLKVDPDLESELITDDGIWLSGEKIEIVMKVSSVVAAYFKRRSLVANQVIEKELADGGLIISTRVGHVNQIAPIVRYWIPHVRIISPESAQAELEKDIAAYLRQSSCV